MRILKKIIDHYSWTNTVLGSLVSAFSLISFIQKLGNIEIGKLPAMYLEYYRDITYSILEIITLPLYLKIPDWYMDMMIIAIILSLINMRVHKLSPIDTTNSTIVNLRGEFVQYYKEYIKKPVITEKIDSFIRYFIRIIIPPLAIFNFIMSIISISYYAGGTELESSLPSHYDDGKSVSIKEASISNLKTLFIVTFVMIFTTILFFLWANFSK